MHFLSIWKFSATFTSLFLSGIWKQTAKNCLNIAQKCVFWTFYLLQYSFVCSGSYDDITNKVVRWYYPSGLASSNKLQYETLIRKEKENKIRKNDSKGNFLSYTVIVMQYTHFCIYSSYRIYENHRTRIPLVMHIYWGEGMFSLFIILNSAFICQKKKMLRKFPTYSWWCLSPIKFNLHVQGKII